MDFLVVCPNPFPLISLITFMALFCRTQSLTRYTYGMAEDPVCIRQNNPHELSVHVDLVKHRDSFLFGFACSF